MLANYHTHTSRCHHAIGSDEEYIQKAIAEGLKILGFSDHAPYLYPNGYVSYYKMTPNEAPEYFSSLSALREKYKDYIKIHIGYEAEYYPEIWNETVEFWKTANSPEYIILGQHFSTQEYAPAEKRHHSTAGTDDCAKLIELLASIYDKKRICAQMKKKFGALDERYMKRAEDMLFGEFAVALGIDKNEVQAYISKRIGCDIAEV